MRALWFIAGMSVVTACVTSGLQGDTDDKGDPDGEGPVRILQVDPDWGPPEGGTDVTITGIGFEGTVELHFGSSPVNVTLLDSETLLVRSPAGQIGNVVDLSIQTDLGTAVADDAFTYSRSQPEGDADTDADSDADTDVTPTGLTGGLVQFSRTQISCPACINYTTDMVVYAGVSLHTPVSGSWLDGLPPSGTCATTTSAPPLSTSSYDIGNFAYLESGSASVAVPKVVDSNGTYYETSNLAQGDYFRSSWDLNASGASGVPSIDLQGAVITPEGFASISPVELLYVNQAAAWAAPFYSTGNNTFTWSPSGPDTFVILIDAFDDFSGQRLGGITCRGADSGSMTIAGSQLAQYPSGSLLVVYLIRYQTTTTVLSHNGATVEGIGQSAVVGTATLY